MTKPLEGLTVLEFSQFLSGPYAGLRLADLGARVIKIERPEVGDLCRNLYISDTDLEGDSTLFHAINRNKESFAANLKDAKDIELVKKLIEKADIITQNFRPGVIERIGLDYKNVKKINPKIVYGTISGYGSDGPWSSLPGQDLLAQSRTGLVWLNGNGGEAPTPMGLAVADMLAGHTLVEGILAAVIKRFRTDNGSHVETSLVEALLDFQFEVLTTYFNDGNRKPQRSSYNNAHAYLSAPYGIYKTSNGYIAIAMTPLPHLGELLDLNASKTKFKRHFARLVRLRTYNWVDFSFKDFLWSFFCNSFNLNATFSRCHEYNATGCTVNYCTKVKLVSDICARFN